jgi:hypothetical protein
MIEMVFKRSLKISICLCTLVACAFFLSRGAVAHGAVSMEADICKLKVAGHFMHFTGYQPQSSRAEFCEDIPALGRAVIVLDFVDDALRDMATSVKIVRSGGSSASIEKMDANGKGSLLFVAPRKYPNGTIKLDVTFDEPGNYVGIVTVGDKNESVATFPFDVGRSQRPMQFAIYGAVVALLAGMTFLWAKRRYSIAPGPAYANRK